MRPTEQQKETAAAVETLALIIEALSRQCAAARGLSMIKLDIEGAEALAFKAVPEELLGADCPFWIVEIHPGALRSFGAMPGEIVARFDTASVETFLLAKHPLDPGAANPALRALVSTESFSDSLYFNMLAVPRGSRWGGRRSAIGEMLPCT